MKGQKYCLLKRPCFKITSEIKDSGPYRLYEYIRRETVASKKKPQPSLLADFSKSKQAVN